jgi:hypothetical protein
MRRHWHGDRDDHRTHLTRGYGSADFEARCKRRRHCRHYDRFAESSDERSDSRVSAKVHSPGRFATRAQLEQTAALY